MTLDEETLAAYQSPSRFFFLPLLSTLQFNEQWEGTQQVRDDRDGANLHVNGSEPRCNENLDEER